MTVLRPNSFKVAVFTSVCLLTLGLSACKQSYVPAPPANQLGNGNYKSAVKYAYDHFDLGSSLVPNVTSFSQEIISELRVGHLLPAGAQTQVDNFFAGTMPAFSDNCNLGGYDISGSTTPVNTLTIEFNDCYLADGITTYFANDKITITQVTPDADFTEAYMLELALDTQKSDCLGCANELREQFTGTGKVLKQFSASAFDETVQEDVIHAQQETKIINSVAGTPKLISKQAVNEPSTDSFTDLGTGVVQRGLNQIIRITAAQDTNIKGISRISTTAAINYVSAGGTAFPQGGSIRIEGANNTFIDIVYANDGSTVSIKLNGKQKQQFTSQTDFDNWRNN